jgi:peptidoglycan/xylan/chitin deacetylase (PgdA/CDA1 family)
MCCRKTVLRIIFSTVVLPLISLTASMARADESQAVVLMYHHFGVQKHPSTNVRLEQFDAHLDYLAEAGYQVWPLKKVAEYVLAKRPFPARVVSISIDDAYLSVFTEAYPRLKKRGWPFTVFVSTDGVDRRFKAYMNWQQMREMQAHGASFENHSASHDYLIRRLQGESEEQWQLRMKADIKRAQRRIREELEVAPTLFAYPYGEYNTTLANLVAELGLVAFGQQSGPVGLSADTRALPRFPMAERFAAIEDFRQKVRSLAFHLLDVQPWEPHVGELSLAEKTAPRMLIRLGESSAKLDRLSCFVSGQGRVEVQWLDRAKRHFWLQPPQVLPPGRSRYNCTAPSDQPGRYYWFSHLWISP